ncbi:MAG: RdgB/HAM1 family non-canonical purine NTP pyrophosphatase [Chthoniobacterales bacterium]
MHRITLATRNAHKTREFAHILGSEFRISDLADTPAIPEVEETGETLAENAILKALAASAILPGTILSDDSGLEVDALQGAPGVRSARYAGASATDAENVAKLITDLRAANANGRPWTGRFHCVIALAKNGDLLETFHGTVHGIIIPQPRGAGGFGYDPVFVPDGYQQTFAEMDASVKDLISHRANAITLLRDYLAKPGDATKLPAS